MDVYGHAFRKVLFPLWETRVRRRSTCQVLEGLEATQWRTLEEIREAQLDDLRALLRHAEAHVPYYRAQLQRIGFTAADLKDLKDLERLPLLRREDAQASFESRKSTVHPLPVLYKQSSGTSGRPLALMYDLGSECWRQATKIRGWGWAGYQPGRPIAILWGVHRPGSRVNEAKIKIDRALRREFYIDVTTRTPERMDDWVETLRRVKPHALTGYASAMVDLAKHVNARGLRTWDTIPVISGAERLAPEDRGELERAFGPRVFDTYGSREMMLMAAECDAHQGLHVSSENLIVELLVDEGGRMRPARPGEVGEVVVTDLHNFGQPFVRYANGDLAVWCDEGPCACGRSMPRLSSIEGRVVETMRNGRGGFVGGITVSVAMVPAAHAVKQFQAVQAADDSITLRIVRGERYDDSVEQGIRTRLAHSLFTPLKVEYVDDIPLTSAGKRRMVVVEPKAP